MKGKVVSRIKTGTIYLNTRSKLLTLERRTSFFHRINHLSSSKFLKRIVRSIMDMVDRSISTRAILGWPIGNGFRCPKNSFNILIRAKTSKPIPTFREQRNVK